MTCRPAGATENSGTIRAALEHRCLKQPGSEEERLGRCLLALLPAEEVKAEGRHEVKHEWEDLKRLLGEARSPAARRGVLGSMAALLRRGDWGSDLAQAFLGVISQAGHPSELPSTRLAAQAALHTSGANISAAFH